ncbi:efflux RND transporter periplasmic adaptor subunit [Candidatus Dependentiae bacterium]|nr:efflux RND transporter periplasmic adaptor subunit [Candidatus Dependentiae bacterium]
MIKNKFFLFIIIFLLISTVIFVYFRLSKKKEQPLFQTQKPFRQDIVQYVNSSGTLKAKEQITVGSLEAGRIIKILADDNDVVKKDQILSIIDNGIGDSQVKKREAELREAKDKLQYQEKFFNRQKQLYESKQISKDLFEQYIRDLETLQEQVKQIQAELEIAKKTYDNLFIKSPADGIVISKKIDLGQMITARFQATVLFVIAKDLHEMEANVDVDEADVGLVHEGQEAMFTVDAFPKKQYFSTVHQIKYLAEIIDNVVTYGVIINVDNPDLKLKPGMTADVDIKVAEAKNALVVKNKTLRVSDDLLSVVAKKLGYQFEKIPQREIAPGIDYLWIFENGNKFRQIKIKIGAREGSMTQIINDEINEHTNIVSEITAEERENILLKQIFSKPGIGQTKKEK